MSVALDLIIAAIIIFSVAGGSSKGLFRSVAGLFGIVCAFIGARLLAGFLAPFLAGVLPLPGVGSRFTSLVNSNSESGAEVAGKAVAEAFGFTEKAAQSIIKLTGDKISDTAGGLIAGFSRTVDELFVYCVSFIICFITILILYRIVVNLLDGVFKLPVLNSVNKIGGAALGLVSGLLCAFVVALLISWMTPLINAGLDAGIDGAMISKTVIFKHLVVFNPLEYIFALI